MSAVLVTGGAGYVGSHACKALAAAGFVPVSYDNLSRGHRRLVKWGPLEIGDVRDGERLRAAIGTHDPVAVMHFAAFAYIAESVAEPARYHENNVDGAKALIEAMRATGTRRMVFSSSCAVYGIPARCPIAEDAPKAPINPYGEGKAAVEAMLAKAGASWGLESVALRYFNAAGADPDGETGELHDPEPHLIPRALMAAAGALPRLDILGADYPTEDGTAVRDYIHVSDLAEGHVRALKRLLGGAGSDAFNLGNGRGASVREIVGAVERVTGRSVPTADAPRRPGDPPVLVADTTRAADALGFAPRFADLETIVESAWRWYRSNAEGVGDVADSGAAG